MLLEPLPHPLIPTEYNIAKRAAAVRTSTLGVLGSLVKCHGYLSLDFCNMRAKSGGVKSRGHLVHSQWDIKDYALFYVLGFHDHINAS